MAGRRHTLAAFDRQQHRCEARTFGPHRTKAWTCQYRHVISTPMSQAVRQIEEHRAALTGHCYRMLGSAVDADDAVQETMVRAWRGLQQFDGRSSLRTWLYRIA